MQEEAEAQEEALTKDNQPAEVMVDDMIHTKDGWMHGYRYILTIITLD